MSVKKSSRKCVALPKLLFCLLNLKHEPRKISVELENTPRVLSLFYFSTWSFGNHKLTLSVKFATLKNTLWKFHLFCLYHTQLSLIEKSDGETYEHQTNEKFIFYLDLSSHIEHGFWLYGRWHADFRNSLMRDKKTELKILSSYCFRMVLITGCPLLNVKNEKSPTSFWKGRKQFDPFVQPMGLKQSYQRNCSLFSILNWGKHGTFLFSAS